MAKQKSIAELEKAFKSEPTAENELALFKARAAEREAELTKQLEQASQVKPDPGINSPDLATALAQAMKKANAPRMRPVKQFVDKLVTCNEWIVERSERNPAELILIEKKREGVRVDQKTIDTYNQSIMNQPRALVLLPEKVGKENQIISRAKITGEKSGDSGEK